MAMDDDAAGSEKQASVGITAQSIYCPLCGQAQPVRMKLLLVLPVGEKYGYFCQVCGAELGAKLEKAPA